MVMSSSGSLDDNENARGLDDVRLRLQDIARSEITRHRGSLGSLSAEQRSMVEALLIATADKISHQIIDRIQSFPEKVQMEYVRVWSSA